MTNREYLIENVKDRLKYLIEYIESCSSVSNRNDNLICDIASDIYFDDCKKCPIDKFCSHGDNEEGCYSNWWNYLNLNGDKEYENNM